MSLKILDLRVEEPQEHQNSRLLWKPLNLNVMHWLLSPLHMNCVLMAPAALEPTAALFLWENHHSWSSHPTILKTLAEIWVAPGLCKLLKASWLLWISMTCKWDKTLELNATVISSGCLTQPIVPMVSLLLMELSSVESFFQIILHPVCSHPQAVP